jgi:hypothetical protein
MYPSDAGSPDAEGIDHRAIVEEEEESKEPRNTSAQRCTLNSDPINPYGYIETNTPESCVGTAKTKSQSEPPWQGILSIIMLTVARRVVPSSTNSSRVAIRSEPLSLFVRHQHKIRVGRA